MTRKKKKSPVEEFNLKFTGKMSILIGLEGHGPMQWRVNDVELVTKVARLILEETDNTTTVNSYDTREQKTLEKILGDIE